MAVRSVAEGVFSGPPERSHLIGSTCRACATVTFPQAATCPRCGGGDTEETALPSDGTLWSWTSQEFCPKEPYLGASAPEDFVPWYVGLVSLGDVIRVEGRLVGVDGPPTIGQAMTTVTTPFARDEDGTEVLTFAFAPASPTPSEGS